MSFRPFEFLNQGWVVEFTLEWLLLNALFYASTGLLIAYLLVSSLGVNHDLFSWLLAGIGFAYGLKQDWEELRAGPSRSTIAVIAYIGLAFFLMALEVLLVLKYFPLS